MKMVVFISVFVCGCNPFWYARPSSENIQTKGWAAQSPSRPQAGLYCYRTLGETQCFSSPRSECSMSTQTCLDFSQKSVPPEDPFNALIYGKKITKDIKDGWKDMQPDGCPSHS